MFVGSGIRCDDQDSIIFCGIGLAIDCICQSDVESLAVLSEKITNAIFLQLHLIVLGSFRYRNISVNTTQCEQ